MLKKLSSGGAGTLTGSKPLFGSILVINQLQCEPLCHSHAPEAVWGDTRCSYVNWWVYLSKPMSWLIISLSNVHSRAPGNLSKHDSLEAPPQQSLLI